MKRIHEEGKAAVGVILGFVGMGIVLIAFGAFGIWAFLNYQSEKNDNDSRIAVAVAKAQKEQSDIDEAKFAEREKDPGVIFAGPENYGRLSFTYPKTWSQYIGNEALSNGATYQAYFNPGAVPSTNVSTNKMALRVSIESADYNSVVNEYSGLVKSGKLTSGSFNVNGTTGVRFDGEFSKEVRGSMVIFRIRDKVVTMSSDADTFKTDFNAIISTIKFNA